MVNELMLEMVMETLSVQRSVLLCEIPMDKLLEEVWQVQQDDT